MNSSKPMISNPYATSKNSLSSSLKDSKGMSNLTSSSSERTNNPMTFSQAFENVAAPSDSIDSVEATVSARTNMTSIVAPQIPSQLQPHVLLISMKQRGNPIIPFICNVPYAYTEITPDFILGSNRCALFLSLKYHNLYPNYIHRRIAELKSDYDLRILLCLVDLDDNASLLLLLNKICCVNNMTLLLSWSEQEAARYLETIKSFENKDASLIQKKKEITYADQVAMTLGCVRSVTKTDASQLLSTFSTLKNVFNASMDDLRLVPGIGDKKVKRLFDAFHKPFSSAMSKKRKMDASLQEMSVVHNDGEDPDDDDDKDDMDDMDKEEDSINDRD